MFCAVELFLRKRGHPRAGKGREQTIVNVNNANEMTVACNPRSYRTNTLYLLALNWSTVDQCKIYEMVQPLNSAALSSKRGEESASSGDCTYSTLI